MDRSTLFTLVVATALFNGLASPAVGLIYSTTPAWLPHLFIGIGEFALLPEFAFYVSSLLLATATLLIGGVPAALLERFFGAEESTPASLVVWLGGCLLLTIPAVLRVVA